MIYFLKHGSRRIIFEEVHIMYSTIIAVLWFSLTRFQLTTSPEASTQRPGPSVVAIRSHFWNRGKHNEARQLVFCVIQLLSRHRDGGEEGFCCPPGLLCVFSGLKREVRLFGLEGSLLLFVGLPLRMAAEENEPALQFGTSSFAVWTLM